MAACLQALTLQPRGGKSGAALLAAQIWRKGRCSQGAEAGQRGEGLGGAEESLTRWGPGEGRRSSERESRFVVERRRPRTCAAAG